MSAKNPGKSFSGSKPARAAVSEFLTQLAERSGAGGYAAIVEVCGFNDWLLDLLPQRGCRHVVLVQPRHSSSRRTDRRDANSLCWEQHVRRLRFQQAERLHRDWTDVSFQRLLPVIVSFE